MANRGFGAGPADTSFLASNQVEVSIASRVRTCLDPQAKPDWIPVHHENFMLERRSI